LDEKTPQFYKDHCIFPINVTIPPSHLLCFKRFTETSSIHFQRLIRTGARLALSPTTGKLAIIADMNSHVDAAATSLSHRQPFWWLGMIIYVSLVGCSSQTKTPVEAAQQPAQKNFTPLAVLHKDPQLVRANFQAEISRDASFTEPSEQELAAQALGRIGKPAVPMLMNALQHRDPHVRLQAAQVLAKIGPEAQAAVPLLVAALDDHDPHVRRAAARALGQIGPAAQEAVPALMRSLVQPETPRN
jgi:hypothetical protein